MSQPRYQVISRIDAGGMAEVFKANSTSMQGFQKLVAIKRVLPSLTRNERFVRMFLDEAKVSLYLNHTNCVQVFDLGIADGTYFIVMEFIDGTNLKNILEEVADRGDMIAIEQACFITIEICKGLSHAHNKIDQQGQQLRIVHRDISPPNVLVSREGEIKITDFGLAKAASQVETTDPGVVKGKFGYLSPEAANGHPVDARTDIFAVGILLWEMLVGQRLFLGSTDLDTLRLVQGCAVRPVTDYRSDVPHQLTEILERALTADPKRRYQDTQSLADDLAHFMFSYGRPVTSYSISRLVNSVIEGRRSTYDPQDSGINEAVQREINKLVSLEEVDDLDLYLAQTYDTSAQASDAMVGGNLEGLEDPSEWFDEEEGVHPDFAAPSGDTGGGGWQETDIGEISQNSSGSYKALRVSEAQADSLEVAHARPASHQSVEQVQQEQRAPHQEQQRAPQRQQPEQHQHTMPPPQQHTHGAHQQPQAMYAQHAQHAQQPHQPHQPLPTAADNADSGGNAMNAILLVAVLLSLVAICVMGYYIFAS